MFEKNKKGSTPLTYVSVISGTVLFSLLMIGISTRFTDINTLASYANAKSFAQSISTRAYTSADCFAYETGAAVHTKGRIQTERRVYPGVIDIRKFTKDRYFSCIQSYYFDMASTRPFLEGVEDISAAFVEFRLIDLENPSQVEEYGDRTLSTSNQLERQPVMNWMVEGLRKFVKYGSKILEGAVFALDIALGAITDVLTLGSVDVEVNLMTLPGYIYRGAQVELPATYGQTLRLGEELVEYIKERESVYSYSTPVVIRYIDENGHFVEDHLGMLRTEVHYTIYGKKQ